LITKSLPHRLIPHPPAINGGPNMYKGFAGAIVLLALAVAYMADSAPKDQAANTAAPAPQVAETAVGAVQSAPVSMEETPVPSPDAGVMPVAGADAPSLTFNEDAPAQEQSVSAPSEGQPADGTSQGGPG
jgi:hypothetical protein